jgi:hypothetical protein
VFKSIQGNTHTHIHMYGAVVSKILLLWRKKGRQGKTNIRTFHTEINPTNLFNGFSILYIFLNWRVWKLDWTCLFEIILNVKLSPYRPGQAPKVPGVYGSHISRESARESGRVISPTHRPSLLYRIYSWHSYLLETESTQGS